MSRLIASCRALRERFFSTGALVILGLATVTSVVVALIPAEEPEGVQFWVVHPQHYEAYLDEVARLNYDKPESRPRVAMTLINSSAAERRLLSGFLSDTPLADAIEVHTGISPKAFLGPVDQIGFLDLTDRLHSEGLYDAFNAPSFSPHTSRGRIFGLPHDVHPVLLAYRSDVVEAAGIDVSQIETWEDFFRVMRPLMDDHDGDGRPDRYLLNLSEIGTSEILMLLLQNDGVIFDENEMPAFANPRNARTLATITTWITGPERVATGVSSFNVAGHKQRLDGIIVAELVADWMLGTWKVENPQLAGKVKVMPIPAWERGGRRTSVNGGSMVGINKRSPHIEESWALIKTLYTSPEVAEATFRSLLVISPLKTLWSQPFYDEPDPYCGGQPTGRMFIEQAPNVPLRPSSPYTGSAFAHIGRVVIALKDYAERHSLYDARALEPVALRLLAEEEAALKRLISRNVFLAETEEAAER